MELEVATAKCLSQGKRQSRDFYVKDIHSSNISCEEHEQMREMQFYSEPF